jgi:hypothetical protein
LTIALIECATGAATLLSPVRPTSVGRLSAHQSSDCACQPLPLDMSIS